MKRIKKDLFKDSNQSKYITVQKTIILDLKKENKELKSEIEKLSYANEDLLEEKRIWKQMSDEYTKLSYENEQLKQQLRNSVELFRKDSVTLFELKEENKELKVNYKELRYANNIYCNKIDSLKKENEQLKKENNILKASNGEYEDALARLEEENEQLKQENEWLKSEIQKLYNFVKIDVDHNIEVYPKSLMEHILEILKIIGDVE